MNKKNKIFDQLVNYKIYNVDLNQKIIFASGIESNVYCDNRKILNYPSLYVKVYKSLIKLINPKEIDVVVGTATAGIAWSSFVANKLKKPNGYVRSSAKDHGTKKLLEGCEVKNQNVLLIEDLITTGESVLKAANVLKELGAKSISIISIFSYNFNLAVQNFKKFNLNYQSLFSIHDLLSYYEKNDSNTYNTLLNWWNQYK